MGSAIGARLTAARRIGVGLAEYEARLAVGEKWCLRCRDWHQLVRFGTDSSRGDGLASSCSESRIAGGDQPGVRERRLKAADGLAWCSPCQRWLAVQEVSRGKCQRHRAAAYRAHYQRNSARIRQQKDARRRHLDPIPDWWADDRITEFGGWCAYGCGRTATGWDHVWPVARGGQSRPGNLVPACNKCNSSKRDRHPATWVDRGFVAFPMDWFDLMSIAVEHGTDEWLELAA